MALTTPSRHQGFHECFVERSGSLTSTGSFKRVAAGDARSVILLAAKDD